MARDRLGRDAAQVERESADRLVVAHGAGLAGVIARRQLAGFGERGRALRFMPPIAEVALVGAGAGVGVAPVDAGVIAGIAQPVLLPGADFKQGQIASRFAAPGDGLAGALSTASSELVLSSNCTACDLAIRRSHLPGEIRERPAHQIQIVRQ